MNAATNQMALGNVPAAKKPNKIKKNSKVSEYIEAAKANWVIIALNCVVWPLALYLRLVVNA